MEIIHESRIVSDPTILDWTYSEIPGIEEVPSDAVIVVWDVPSNTFGLMMPWGDELNPTRWSHGTCHNCLDGCWSESRGEPKRAADGYGMIIRENGVNLVQHRLIRKPVWWAWVRRGTPGLVHPHPTWRQVHGPLDERDWE